MRHALFFLVAVEKTGGEEEHGEHEGQLGVRLGMDVKLHHAVSTPYDTSDKPDPGCLSHCLEIGRTGWRAGFDCGSAQGAAVGMEGRARAGNDKGKARANAEILAITPASKLAGDPDSAPE